MTQIHPQISIYSCPNCNFLVIGGTHVTLSSNTIGSKLLSNGRSAGGPYAEPIKIPITRCQECKEYFVLNHTNLEGRYTPPPKHEINEKEIFEKVHGKLNEKTKDSELNVKYQKWIEFRKKIKERKKKSKRIPSFEEVPPEWLKAPFSKGLPIEKIAEALDQGVTKNKEEERKFRKLLWWKLNNYDLPLWEEIYFELRTLDKSKLEHIRSKYKKIKLNNCKKLLALLAEYIAGPELEERNRKERSLQKKSPGLRLGGLTESEALLMKAEILRQLGKFEEAIQILDTLPEEFKWISNQLIIFAKEKVAKVQYIER